MLRAVGTPQFEILDYVDTPIGTLSLRRRELLGRPGTLVTEVSVGHELLMSSLNTLSEVALADEAIALHAGRPAPRVLVGGLGLGYTAHAALAGPGVEYVEVVDRLPEVMGWMRKGLLPLSSELNADPRIKLVEGDAYARLLRPPAADEQGFDSILIDIDHTPTERLAAGSAAFYTAAGQRKVMQHLRLGGVLGVWSAGDDDAFAGVLCEVYPEARRARVRWVNELIDDGEEVEDVIFLARVADSRTADSRTAD